jgi:predicted RNase H-like nuclease
MIEVYPHPALVALFGLPRRLAYKARSGRSIDDRRVALRALIRLLESLYGADPPLDVTTAPRWPQLTAAVESASTHAGLDRVEDELDAFVCAYVGLYWAAWGRARSAVLGTVADGYIVTPVDPERAKRVIAMLPFPEPAAEEAVS